MTDLILPLVIWNGVPHHSITSLLLLPEKGIIVTGSTTGQLCIWNLEPKIESKEGSLIPKLVCVGHEKPIVAIVAASYDSREVFVSVSTDGTISIWNLQDGRCFATSPQFLHYYPLALASIPTDGRFLVSAGSACDLDVIDLSTMKISTWKGHSDWITCVTATVLDESPLVISGSRDGLIHFWALQTSEDYPLRTICLDERWNANPLATQISPDFLSFIVVTPSEWILYIAYSSKVVAVVECPYPCGWVGGAYVDNCHVVIWTRNGKGCVYQIHIPDNVERLSLEATPPKSPTTAASSSMTTPDKTFNSSSTQQKSHQQEQPSSILVDTIIENTNFFPISYGAGTPDTIKSQPPIQVKYTINENYSSSSYEISFLNWAKFSNGIMALGDTNGHLNCFDLKTLSAYLSGSFADGWKGVTMEPLARSVTASLIVEDILLMVRGHDNGQVSFVK